MTNDNEGLQNDGLPDGWAWTTIGDIVFRMSNGTTATQSKEKHGIPVTRIETIANGVIDLERVGYIADASGDTYEKYKLASGDILFSHINSDSHLGKTAIYKGNQPLLHGMNLLLLRPNTALIVPEYLHYLCNHYRSSGKFVSVAQHAVNQSSINQAKLKQIRVPLAPLSEQHLIVAKIEEQFTRLDAGVAALKRAQANLKRYKASVLKAACEGKLVKQDPSDEPASELLKGILAERRAKWEVDLRAKGKEPQKAKYDEPRSPDIAELPELPQGWCWTSTESVSDPSRPITYGILKPGPYIPDGIPMLRILDIKNGSVDLTNVHRVSTSLSEEYHRTVLSGGECLVSMVGTIGLVAFVPRQLQGINVHRNLGVIATCDLYMPEFLVICLSSPIGQAQIREFTTGANQPLFNIGELKRVAIPVPPLAEQRRIVAEVERRLSVVQELEATLTANLARAERLRQSILKRAFEGKLVP